MINLSQTYHSFQPLSMSLSGVMIWASFTNDDIKDALIDECQTALKALQR